MAGGIGIGTAIGTFQSPLLRHLPVQLITDQDPVADDFETLGCDSLIIPAAGGQPILGDPVPGDVQARAAVSQTAELIYGGERGPGKSRLVPQGSV